MLVRAICSGPLREELPRFVPPMLASPGPLPTSGEGWTAEVKWDGMRAQLRFDGQALCLRSRPGRDCSEEFPELAAIRDALAGHRVILDGELVCLGSDGKPDFTALRNRLGGQRRGPAPATFMAFDVLHLDGRAVRHMPYSQRRAILEELALDGPSWRTPMHFPDELEALAAATAAQGLEGVVLKRLDSRYAAGRRSTAWIKRKHLRRETLVVTGWRPATSRRAEEFLVARRSSSGVLRPAGSVSLGLDAPRRRELVEQLQSIENGRRGQTRWVRPEITVAVDCHGAHDGPVRDAVLR